MDDIVVEGEAVDMPQNGDREEQLRAQLKRKEKELAEVRMQLSLTENNLGHLKTQQDQVTQELGSARAEASRLADQLRQTEQRLHQIETDLKLQQEKLKQAKEKLSEGEWLSVLWSLFSVVASFLIGWGTNLLSTPPMGLGIGLVIVGSIIHCIILVASKFISSRASKAI